MNSVYQQVVNDMLAGQLPCGDGFDSSGPDMTRIRRFCNSIPREFDSLLHPSWIWDASSSVAAPAVWEEIA